MFGRHPLLPIDLILNHKDLKKPTTHKDYVNRVSETMFEAYKLASETAQKQQQVDTRKAMTSL